MEFNEYQELAMRTKGENKDFNMALIMGALGASGEAGEIADHVKKVVFHEHPLNINNLAKEMGDVMWYLAYLSDVIGVPLDKIADMNIQKLKDRYPDGFSSEASINRRE